MIIGGELEDKGLVMTIFPWPERMPLCVEPLETPPMYEEPPPPPVLLAPAPPP